MSPCRSARRNLPDSFARRGVQGRGEVVAAGQLDQAGMKLDGVAAAVEHEQVVVDEVAGDTTSASGASTCRRRKLSSVWSRVNGAAMARE